MGAHPVVAIIGAGAVGSYYGARLAQSGQSVNFLFRSDFEAVRAGGLRIRSCDGDFHLPPTAIGIYNDPRRMPKADLVFVALKTTSNQHLPALIEPLLKSDTTILTLQNGLGNEERLAELFGRQRVVGGMAFTCINRVGPGMIHHMAEGWLRIGEFGGGPSDRVTQIAKLFQAAGIDCKPLDDLRRGRWEKLSWNIPFNGLGAVMDLTTDRLIDTKDGQELVTAIIEEVIAAAKAIGVSLSPDLPRRQIEKTRPMGAYQTSMQVDRRAGRPMEVEAILGEPLRQGKAAGATLPRMETLYHMARAINPVVAS